MRHYIPFTKKIDLRNVSDRQYLFKSLKSIREFDSQILQIKKIVKLFIKYLSDEWLTFHPYPIDGVELEIDNHKSIALNFVDDIIPLGQAIQELQRLGKFKRLIEKLNTKAHDRLSAVMEALFSAKYKKRGYPVQLEPTTILNKRPDFKAKVNGEWIFFECKAENYFESESFSQNNRFFHDISKKIKKGLSAYNNISIELRSKRKVSNKDLQVLIKRMEEEIQRNNFDNSIQCYDIHFTISKVLSNSNMGIQVSQFVYSGTSRDKRRLGNLLNSARDQLPSNKKCVIILKAHNMDIALPIARDKIKRNDYLHISAIVIIKSGEGKIVLNPQNAFIPIDFIRILLSEPLPSYWW